VTVSERLREDGRRVDRPARIHSGVGQQKPMRLAAPGAWHVDEAQSVLPQRVVIDVHSAIDLTIVGRAVKINFAHGGELHTCSRPN
jgi:hypothetical protein